MTYLRRAPNSRWPTRANSFAGERRMTEIAPKNIRPSTLPPAPTDEIDSPGSRSPHHFRLADGDQAVLGPFANWRAAIGAVFDVAARPGEIAAFSGDLEMRATAHILLSRIACSSLRLGRSPRTLSRGRLDHFALWLVASGSLAGLAGRTPVEAEAGDVMFLDMQQTVDLVASISGRVTESLALWIPRARLLASMSDENALHGLVLKGTSPAGALIGAGLRTYVSSANRMSVAEMDALANGIIELTAKAVGPPLETLGASDGASALISFVTIRRFIDRNLTLPQLDADGLARQFGLSRSTLYRLFEPVGGIAGYIRRQRLYRAYQEVVATETSNARIGQIGYRLGFGNVSAFSRTFRARFGMSPREARKAALAGARAPPLKSEPAREGASLAGWLAELGRH
jgi:AraC-like DNA-binding protein